MRTGTPEQLDDINLLAIAIGTTREDAARVLAESGGLVGLARGAAQQVDVLGRAPLRRLDAALELGRRTLSVQLAERRTFVHSHLEVAEWARPRLSALEHEEVWVLALDARNGLKFAKRVAQGGFHGCSLTPREVLRPALVHAASALVLVHNHPSGDPTPSAEDFRMTRAVAVAADVVGVPLLDHVVVARGGSASLLELGAFDR